MKSKLLTSLVTALVALSLGSAHAADKAKSKPAETPAAGSKTDATAKRDTYPFKGKVVEVTPRTITIVRSEKEDAKQAKYSTGTSTEYVNGDKAATAADVKVGKWISGLIKKAEGNGNDTMVKINVAAKAPEPKAKGDAKSKKDGK